MGFSFRSLRSLAPLLPALLVTGATGACSSDDEVQSAPPGMPSSGGEIPPGQGILRVRITGLPAGQDASVIVTANDFERVLTASADIPVPPGEYAIIAKGIADPVKKDGSGFRPSAGITTVTVPASAGAVARVAYSAVAPKIAPEAKVATNDAAAALTGITRDPATGSATLSFSKATPETSSWRSGDLLVFGVTPATPQGFLGRVTSTNGTTVITSAAALQDVIEDGVIDFARSFSPADVKTVDALTAFAPNVRLCGSVATELSPESGGGTGAVALAGDMCIAPSVELNVVTRLLQVPDVYFKGSAGLTGSLSVDGHTSTAIAAAAPIVAISLGTFVVPVGPIPVVIAPKLTISVGANGAVTAGVHAGVDYTSNPTGGFFFDGAKRQSRPFASERHDFGPDWPTPISKASLKGSAGPNLELVINGLGGPYLRAEESVTLQVDPLGAPSWELHGGVGLEAGVSNERLFHIDYGANILALDSLLLKAGDRPPPGAKLSTASNLPSDANPALGPSDVLYVATGSEVRAVKADGAPLWSYAGTGAMTSVVRGADGSIWATDDGGTVYALTSSGTEKWTKSFGVPARVASPAAGTLYVSGGSTASRVDPNDGSVTWSTDVGPGVRSLSVAKDGTIYAPVLSGLQALTPAGELKWASPAPVGGAGAPEVAVAADGTVIAVVLDGVVKVAAVRPDGTVKWKQAALGSDVQSSPVIGPDGTVYVCGDSPDASLVAIDGATGTTKWKVAHGESCHGPPAVGANGTLYLMTDASFRAISAATGKIAWTKPAPSKKGAPKGSPLFLSNGNVAAVNAGGLYVFAAGTSLAAGGWPRLGFDASGAGAVK